MGLIEFLKDYGCLVRMYIESMFDDTPSSPTAPQTPAYVTVVLDEEASVPPLAIAFLVGYAVDVFFAFLEGLLQAFTKKAASS